MSWPEAEFLPPVCKWGVPDIVGQHTKLKSKIHSRLRNTVCKTIVSKADDK